MAQPSGGGGKPLHALSDTALFVEDRSGQETALARRAREKRPLKSLEILNRNNAGAAPLHARERASFRIKQTPEGKAAAAGMSKKMKDKLRRIAGRGDQVKGAMGELADSQGSVGQEQSGAVKLAQKQAYDVWGSDDTPASSKGKGKGKGKDKDTSVDEEWVTIRDQKPIKAPKTMYEDHVLSAARSIPSVSLPHPGMSYNPDLESHERLIQEAYAIEKRLEDGEQVDQAQRDEWIRKVAEAKELAEQLANSDKRYNGMQVDLPSDGSDDDASNDDEDDENAQGTRKMPKKKTKAQRMRAKRAAQEVAQAKARREAKAQKQLVAQLPKLRKQYEAAARARIAAAEQRRLAKEERLRAHGLQGKKLGKHRVPREKIDVQTGEELSESLRALKVSTRHLSSSRQGTILTHLNDCSLRETCSATDTTRCRQGRWSSLVCPSRRPSERQPSVSRHTRTSASSDGPSDSINHNAFLYTFLA